MCMDRELIGKTFGRWTVVDRAPNGKNGGKRYICKCTCGTLKAVDAYHLKNGNSKSCGCLRFEMALQKRRENAIGKKFGRLTVIGSDDIFYHCMCECGRSISFNKKKIHQYTSCGCAARSHFRKQMFFDITGLHSKPEETIIFLDGDINHTTADNLMSVSKPVYSQMKRNGMLTTDKELTRSAALVCMLSHEIAKHESEF